RQGISGNKIDVGAARGDNNRPPQTTPDPKGRHPVRIEVMGVDKVETGVFCQQSTNEADCRCSQEGRANRHANPWDHRETWMMDGYTMACLLPVDPGISGPVAEVASGRREIRHRSDDDAFHLPACNQMA